MYKNFSTDSQKVYIFKYVPVPQGGGVAICFTDFCKQNCDIKKAFDTSKKNICSLFCDALSKGSRKNKNVSVRAIKRAGGGSQIIQPPNFQKGVEGNPCLWRELHPLRSIGSFSTKSQKFQIFL